MKRLPVPPIPPEIVESIRASIASGKPLEEVIRQMRQVGLYMTDSIMLLHRLCGLSPHDAKMAVHFSKTWADCREANDAFHETAFEAAKQLGFEEVESSRPILQATR